VNDEDELNFRRLLARGEHRIAEGRMLVNVHPEIMCVGRGCSVHHPSDHKMKMWPKDFIFPEDQPGNWGHFMRYCQHRIAHPDPDDIVYWAEHGRDITPHDCDGCCRSEIEEY
jgi:hypothetical protein